MQKNNKKVIAYGAAAKGNTLLNFSKIDSKLINFTFNLITIKVKQNKFLPE